MFAETILDACRKEIERIEKRIAELDSARDGASHRTAWQLRTEADSLSDRMSDVEQIQRIALALD